MCRSRHEQWLSIEVCLVVGGTDPGRFGHPEMVDKVIMLAPCIEDGEKWARLGFSSWHEAMSVERNVDLLVVVVSPAGPAPGTVVQVLGLLEEVCDDHAILCIVSEQMVDGVTETWPYERALQWGERKRVHARAMPGGLALSFTGGHDTGLAASRLADLLRRAAEVPYRIVAGRECLAAGGSFCLPACEGDVVLVSDSWLPRVDRHQGDRVVAVSVEGGSGFLPRPPKFARCHRLQLINLHNSYACFRVGAFAYTGLFAFDLGRVRQVPGHFFEGCVRLHSVGVTALEDVGAYAFAETGLSFFANRCQAVVGVSAFSECAFTSFSCPVWEWGKEALSNCHRLERLLIGPGWSFDCLALLGHIPREIRYCGPASQARAAFSDLCLGSPTPFSIFCDDDALEGGMGSTIGIAESDWLVRTGIPSRGERDHLGILRVDMEGHPWELEPSFMDGFLWVAEVVLPRGLARIPLGAFEWCTSLRRVNMESCPYLVELGERCFGSCTSLTCPEFPGGLQYIGLLAFWGSGLKHADLSGCHALVAADLGFCPWLHRVRAHRGTLLQLTGSSRMQEAEAGPADFGALTRLARLRASTFRADKADCRDRYVAEWARVTGERPACRGRLSGPAMPP